MLALPCARKTAYRFRSAASLLLESFRTTPSMSRMSASPSPERRNRLYHVARMTLIAASSFALSGQAMALDTLPERQRIEIQRRTEALDVPLLRQRLRREKFQRRQDALREGDRARGDDLRMDLPVRRMRRNCQLQPFGANFLPNCR